MASAEIIIPADTARITGPLLLGYLFNWGLFGVLSVQVYTYHTVFPTDEWRLKLLVFLLFTMETMQTIMITSDAFRNFVYGYGRIAALDSINLIWFDVCILDGIVAFCVQVYFAYRIYLLSRSKMLTLIILFMALTQLSGAIVTGVLAQVGGLFSLVRIRCFIPACFWLGGSAGCDILIAAFMIWALSRYKTRFQESGDLIRRLIRLTMETGGATALVAFIDLVLYLSLPDGAYHITPALMLAKLYSNSLMVLLNSRPGAWKPRPNDRPVMGDSPPDLNTIDITRRNMGNSRESIEFNDTISLHRSGSIKIIPPPSESDEVEEHFAVNHTARLSLSRLSPIPGSFVAISRSDSASLYSQSTGYPRPSPVVPYNAPGGLQPPVPPVPIHVHQGSPSTLSSSWTQDASVNYRRSNQSAMSGNYSPVREDV